MHKAFVKLRWVKLQCNCEKAKDKSLSVEKVKEEIGELIEAVENNSNKIHEAADVLYHLLVYLEGNGVRIEDIMDELEKRKKKKES